MNINEMSKSIPSSCRVPVFAGNKQIRFSEKPVSQPGPGQLLLRVYANALCGSERSQFFDGTTTVPGHEAAGTVVAAGPGTPDRRGYAGRGVFDVLLRRVPFVPAGFHQPMFAEAG